MIRSAIITGSYAIAALVALAATTAHAREPVPARWVQGPWTVYSLPDENRCALRYGTEPRAPLILGKGGSEPAFFRYFLPEAPLPGEEQAARLWLDSESLPLHRFSKDGTSLFVPYTNDAKISELIRTARTLQVRVEDKVLSELPLDGVAQALAALERCAAYWPDGVQRPLPPLPPVPPAIPEPDLTGPFESNLLARRLAPNNWITSSDYPEAALSEGRDGRTGVELRISAVGRVEACAVTLSSGHADLDAATCALLKRKARFQPATDPKGKPITAVTKIAITWAPPETHRNGKTAKP